jgi:hypothetical protein
MNIKKIIVVLCLLATSFLSNAQKLGKGTWLVGGGLSYLNASGANVFLGNLSGFNMVSKNIALGANVTYISSGSTLIAGPQARYYFNREKPSKFFLLSSINFNTESSSGTFNVGAGLANFISDYVSIDITGNYGSSFSYISNVVSLQVGLQIYLPKKK